MNTYYNMNLTAIFQKIRLGATIVVAHYGVNNPSLACVN